MNCSQLQSILSGASPKVTLTNGELCSNLISNLLNTSVEHLNFSDVLNSNSTCDSNIKVNLTSSNYKVADDQYMLPYPLIFDDTSATCMDAPYMNYDGDIKIWNEGRMDSWNTARDPGFGMS